MAKKENKQNQDVTPLVIDNVGAGVEMTTIDDVTEAEMLQLAAELEPVAGTSPDAQPDTAPAASALHCGLPPQLQTKSDMRDYTALHGFVGGSYNNIEYTEKEREMFEDYHRFGVGPVRSPKELYVCTLRLWNAGFGLKLPKRRDINDLKVS